MGQNDIRSDRLPRHVAIIMDGNGRWAEARGLERNAGHRAGVESVREVVRAAGDLGIEVLTLYAFSSENWGRPQGEVRELMRGSRGSRAVARRSQSRARRRRR